MRLDEIERCAAAWQRVVRLKDNGAVKIGANQLTTQAKFIAYRLKLFFPPCKCCIFRQ